MRKNKRKRRKKPAPPDQVVSRQVKTTIDFGDDGLLLEFLWTVREAVHRQHKTVLDRPPLGHSSAFVPISMARYVELHLAANPGTDREEFTSRLRGTADASKSGTRCACGAPIWVIGPAEAGIGCFTCLTGEAIPDGDYEIDEVIGSPHS